MTLFPVRAANRAILPVLWRDPGLRLVSGIPVVRDLASAVGHGTSYRPTPAADAIDKLLMSGQDAGRALGMIEGEPSDR